MSKRRKGVSADEKRTRLLEIYTTTKEVFNLKEIEKLGSKKGIVTQTIKDVNQSLIDDSLVDCEKIGAGNYYWAFPSKASQKAQKKLEDLKVASEELKSKIKQTELSTEELRKTRVETDKRKQDLLTLESLRAKKAELEQELEKYKENDPEVLKALDQNTKLAKEGADRWTDNIWNIKSYMVKKRNCCPKEVNRALEITDDFDYVE